MNKIIKKEIADIAKKLGINYSTIREFQDKVNWGNISRNQKLSEDFIREFSHKLNPIKMIFPDNSCETIFMFNQKVELGSKIYSILNKKYFVVVEISDDRKEVWME